MSNLSPGILPSSTHDFFSACIEIPLRVLIVGNVEVRKEFMTFWGSAWPSDIRIGIVTPDNSITLNRALTAEVIPMVAQRGTMAAILEQTHRMDIDRLIVDPLTGGESYTLLAWCTGISGWLAGIEAESAQSARYALSLMMEKSNRIGSRVIIPRLIQQSIDLVVVMGASGLMEIEAKFEDGFVKIWSESSRWSPTAASRLQTSSRLMSLYSHSL